MDEGLAAPNRSKTEGRATKKYPLASAHLSMYVSIPSNLPSDEATDTCRSLERPNRDKMVNEEEEGDDALGRSGVRCRGRRSLGSGDRDRDRSRCSRLEDDGDPPFKPPIA